MSVIETAKYLRLDKTHVRRLIRKGIIPATKRIRSRDGLHYAYRIDKSRLDSIMEKA